jgi:hypothetical protein
LLKALLGGLQAGWLAAWLGRCRRRRHRLRGRGGWHRRHALRHLAALCPCGSLFGLALHPLGLLDAAIGLGADTFLLALYLSDLFVHPLFDESGILVADGRPLRSGGRRGHRRRKR